MIGLGVLEALSAADVLTRTDPEGRDIDGFSSRDNLALSMEVARPMPGRFGPMAGAPMIRKQVASAFSDDMGVTTMLLSAIWSDCTAAQSTCHAAGHGAQADHGGHEVSNAARSQCRAQGRACAG